MSIVGRAGRGDVDSGGYKGLVMMVWAPGYDSIMAWEHRQSGVWSAAWIEETCVRLMGGRVQQHFSLHRFGFVGYARVPTDKVDATLERFVERFDEAWREKQQEVALPNWTGVAVTCPYQRAAEQVVDLQQRMLTLAEGGEIPTTPAMLSRYDVDDFCQTFSVPRAAWWPRKQAVPE